MRRRTYLEDDVASVGEIESVGVQVEEIRRTY